MASSCYLYKPSRISPRYSAKSISSPSRSLDSNRQARFPTAQITDIYSAHTSPLTLSNPGSVSLPVLAVHLFEMLPGLVAHLFEMFPTAGTMFPAPPESEAMERLNCFEPVASIESIIGWDVVANAMSHTGVSGSISPSTSNISFLGSTLRRPCTRPRRKFHFPKDGACRRAGV
jgi:hypothetical protein